MMCCWLQEILIPGLDPTSYNVEWSGVKGIHGVGNVNEARRVLLTFCAVNDLALMNSWYEKKDIYKYTWQHPGSRIWHCIDFF